MTNTSKLSVKVGPFEEQVWDAFKQTEKYGPSRLTAMCDTARWVDVKQCLKSQGSMRVLLTNGDDGTDIVFAANLVHVYIDDELNVEGKNAIDSWIGPSWCESDWESQDYRTIYVIQNCIRITPIPIDSLKKQDGGSLDGESAGCSIVQGTTVVPLREPPRHALSNQILGGSFAVKTQARQEHLAEATKRTNRDGPDELTALVSARAWKGPKKLLAKKDPVRVYYAEHHLNEEAHVTHVAELVDAFYGNAYATEGTAALEAWCPSVDPDLRGDWDAERTVYVIKNCVRVWPFPVADLTKHDGDHADSQHLYYTIVKAQKLSPCDEPTGPQKSGVGPPEFKPGRASSTHSSGAQTAPRLPGEQDMSTAWDGAIAKIKVNRYERNSGNRDKCIKAHGGPKCQVCEMTFAQTYGQHGAGYIHVHHVTPLSKIKKAHKPDALNDLKPVCPNCHAMLHKEKADGTCYMLGELKEIVQNCRPSSSGFSTMEDRVERKSRVSSLPPPGQA